MDHLPLGEGGELFERAELADPDPAPGEPGVPQQGPRHTGGPILIVVKRRAGRVGSRLGSGFEVAGLGDEIGGVLRSGRAAESDVAQRVVREPVDSVAPTDETREDDHGVPHLFEDGFPRGALFPQAAYTGGPAGRKSRPEGGQPWIAESS